jgi:DNA ligase (NAD+)
MEQDKIDRMRAMAAQLNDAADAYYNGLGELMTDFEWDALFDRLKALEKETGIVLPESPTNRVSADDVAGQKEPHEFPALSLAKTKSVADVAKWAEGRPIWLSWKLDGLTLVVTYDGGRLSKVVTRGDGHVGTNITHLAAGIRGLPQTVCDEGHLVVRGEAVISYADFEEFCAISQEDYANPRNLAAGSLTLKNVEELAPRNLQWIPFSLVNVEPDILSWGARMDHLDAIGLRAVERERIDIPDESSIQAAIDRWTRKVTDKTQPFPVDGLVVVYDDIAYSRTGSVTGHHATRAGYAFKWQDETAATTLDHIEWSCAVGSICPVAVFMPVALEGTTVKRASLCNISECERLGIGGPGTALSVIKANKIIPKVVEVTEKVGEFAIPGACPVCGAPAEVRTSDTGTKTLRCTNGGCPAKALAKYERFVSKAGMDIDGLAGETIAKFVNNGWIRSVADIYRLGAHRAEIAALDGFGQRSADNICAAVEAAREREATRFIVALSIPLCGIDVAKRLLRTVSSVQELFDKAVNAPSDDVFADIDGLGAVRSAAFVQWCKAPENQALVADLLGQVSLSMPAAASGGKCAGITFVVTGDLHHYANRDALKAFIESQGGKVAGSVSAKTGFLINNDVTSTSGKNKKAQSLGIPVISEDEFISRFGT